MASASYTLGPTPPGTKPTATFETKPTPTLWDRRTPGGGRRSRYDTGGGYERWRSFEPDPTTPGDRKRDVYAAVHRLCAVAWLLPEDAPLSAMEGVDVHHELGVEWANIGESPNFADDYPDGCLTLMEHGRHSEVTRGQMRAWAESAKEEARAVERGEPQIDTCDGCGEPAETLCTSADFDGERCVECAKRASKGAPIQVG